MPDRAAPAGRRSFRSAAAILLPRSPARPIVLRRLRIGFFRPKRDVERPSLQVCTGRYFGRCWEFVQAMMRTLFLQAPSFDGCDRGAGARYQMRREVRSFWYPTWRAQPAALVKGSKLIDAPPHTLTV